MKFIPDANPKKVRIIPETAEETAWVNSLREEAKRIQRGSEKYALAAYNEWRRNPPKLDIGGLAAAMMGGPAPSTKADRRAERIEALKAEGREAIAEFDNAMGLMCREARGVLIRIANEFHQIKYGKPYPFPDESREERAWRAADWLRRQL